MNQHARPGNGPRRAGRHEDNLDRLLDDGLLGDTDERAVFEKGGVERGQRMVFKIGVTRQMAFDQSKVRRQAAGFQTFRQAARG